MKLKRNLEEPNLIYINGKCLKLEHFHNTTARLGFTNIDGFHMHRLVEEEISKMCHFSGDDLWSLVSGLCTSMDLVKAIEMKHVSLITSKRNSFEFHENISTETTTDPL